MLKDISKLVEYVTGLDTRIGYPNEHIAKSIADEIKSPMYATAVGLVIKGLNDITETISEAKADEQDLDATNKLPKPGGFLNKWIAKGMEWLNDDDMKDF